VSLDDFNIELNYNITDKSLEILKKHINKSSYMLESAKIFLDIDRLPDFYSRLYYSCYHIINSLFFLYGLLVKSDIFIENKEMSSHGALIGFFNRYFIKSRIFDKSFSTLLIDFQVYRMAADYDFEEFDKEKSINNYNDGLNFVNTIKDKINSGLEEIRK
jgi:uncharacterized protein (UPF0332 family)